MTDYGAVVAIIANSVPVLTPPKWKQTFATIQYSSSIWTTITRIKLKKHQWWRNLNTDFDSTSAVYRKFVWF